MQGLEYRECVNCHHSNLLGMTNRVHSDGFAALIPMPFLQLNIQIHGTFVGIIFHVLSYMLLNIKALFRFTNIKRRDHFGS